MSATLPKHHTLGTLEMDKRCSTCEETTDTDADYCSTCGSMLEVLPTKLLSGSGLKRCGKCNKSLSTDRAFCRTCGTALEQVQDNEHDLVCRCGDRRNPPDSHYHRCCRVG